MAQTTTKPLPSGAWVLLTDADVTNATFQNVDPDKAWIMGSVDATAPADLDGALVVLPGDGARNVALADLWPGSAFVRLFAYSEGGGAMAVSHA